MSSTEPDEEAENLEELSDKLKGRARMHPQGQAGLTMAGTAFDIKHRSCLCPAPFNCVSKPLGLLQIPDSLQQVSENGNMGRL